MKAYVSEKIVKTTVTGVFFTEPMENTPRLAKRSSKGLGASHQTDNTLKVPDFTIKKALNLEHSDVFSQLYIFLFTANHECLMSSHMVV